jgi:hypothetical protein
VINSAIAAIARMALGRKILGVLAAVNGKLSGHRSEILLALMALCHLLEKVGIVPDGAAIAVDAALAPALPVTLMEKVSKVISLIDKIAPNAPAA